VSSENQQVEFFRLSEEAERQSRNAPNPEVAEKWRRLAAGYRDLAELARLQLL